MIAPLPKPRWQAVVRECAGKIGSLVELLQGKFSRAVMEMLIRREAGLFPSAREIAFECSCPDWAAMCKHVAATLYGVGARLDAEPELFFRLRRVDQLDLLTAASSGAALAARGGGTRKRIAGDGAGRGVRHRAGRVLAGRRRVAGRPHPGDGEGPAPADAAIPRRRATHRDPEAPPAVAPRRSTPERQGPPAGPVPRGPALPAVERPATDCIARHSVDQHGIAKITGPAASRLPCAHFLDSRPPRWSHWGRRSRDGGRRCADAVASRAAFAAAGT